VKTIERLKEILADGKRRDFWLLLRPGLHSRKTLRLCKNGKIEVKSHIDGLMIYLAAEELFTTKWTDIGDAMTSGNFIVAPEVVSL